MQEIIRQIRLYLNMSQTEFAERLNVTFAELDCWENGTALISKSVQSRMYDLCKSQDVPVYDMILQKKGTPFYNKYCDMAKNKDLIIGSIANDRMFYVIDNFFIGNITDMALVNSLSALELGRQYVAVTQRGCDAVRIECEVPISHLERLFIQEVAETNRVNGVSLANSICKNYRRDGMYFDEILDHAQKGEKAWTNYN